MHMKDIGEIKKEMILRLLSRGKHKSTSTISDSIKANWDRTLFLLDGLLKEKNIKKVEETRAIYWKITKKGRAGLVKI